MHNVTDDEIDFILDDIAKRGVVTEDVQYNILDHVCCIIENEMPLGANFNEFYRNTIARFYHKELKEIEEETRKLTTFKYYHAMKRTLKITGIISVLLIALGSILKAQHLPGAGVTLFSGFIVFSLLFIPLNIIMKFRDDNEKYNRVVVTLGMTLTLTGTLGLLFKVMHWPYANIIFFGSLALFGLVFIPIYFFTRYRNPETKFNASINSVFMIAAAGMLFTMINLKPSQNIEESVESMDDFQTMNLENLKTANQSLYAEFKSVNTDLVKMKKITADLDEKIENIRFNLIAKSNGTSVELVKSPSLKTVKNPNDSHVILHHFDNANDDFSYTSLKTALNEYNAALKELNAKDIIRPIEIENLQMTHTILSVVLQDLVAIQIQLMSNENSYLCLQKGLMGAS